MKKTSILLVLTIILLETGNVRPETCHIGERQSPIDIQTSGVRYQQFRPFQLTGYENLSFGLGTLIGKNTGTTLKMLSKAQAPAVLAGGPLNVAYEFVEMHFHWGDIDEGKGQGSEHKIDGKSYPLELHMVHKNIHDASVEEALTHENGLTVMGFKFEIVEDKSIKNPGMDTLTAMARKFLKEPDNVIGKKELEKVHHEEDVNAVNFLPFLMDEYFYYHGSLTTGGCEEAVNWVVFKTPLAIHVENLRDLQTLHNREGTNIINNIRPTQPVNDRPIYYHGLDLIKRGILSRGSAVGQRSRALPTYDQFILDLPPSGRIRPAPLAHPAPLIPFFMDQYIYNLANNGSTCAACSAARRLGWTGAAGAWPLVVGIAARRI